MTEEELKIQNPFLEVADLMSITNSLWFPQQCLVCHDDAEIITEFNKKYSNRTDRQFELHTPPFPFVGNVLSSKVVILSLNPGYVEILNRDMAIELQETKPEIAEALSKSQQRFMRLEGKAIYETAYDEEKVLGDRYWERMLRELREIYKRNNKEEETVYSDFSIIQLYGYSSTKFSPLKRLTDLTSYAFTRKVIKYLAENTECLFLVMRQQRTWEKILGEKDLGVLSYLKKQGRYVGHTSHFGKQYVTLANLGVNDKREYNFNIITRHLGLETI